MQPYEQASEVRGVCAYACMHLKSPTLISTLHFFFDASVCNTQKVVRQHEDDICRYRQITHSINFGVCVSKPNGKERPHLIIMEKDMGE